VVYVRGLRAWSACVAKAPSPMRGLRRPTFPDAGLAAAGGRSGGANRASGKSRREKGRIGEAGDGGRGVSREKGRIGEVCVTCVRT